MYEIDSDGSSFLLKPPFVRRASVVHQTIHGISHPQVQDFQPDLVAPLLSAADCQVSDEGGGYG